MKGLVACGWLAVTVAASAAPLERATFDTAGKLVSLIQGGTRLGVQTQFVVRFVDGSEVNLQPDNQQSPISGDLRERRWQGKINFPNGGNASLAAAWTDAEDGGVALDAALTAGSPLDVQVLACIIDVPRADFQGGRLEPAGGELPTTKPEDITFYRGETNTLTFVAPTPERTLTLRLDRKLPVTVTDRWNASGRSYRVRITLRAGAWPQGETSKLGLGIKTTGQTPAAAPVHLTVDPAAPRFAFDGYGANYCWARQGPVTDYLLEHLQQGWTRHELKAVDWDEHRDHPNSAVTQDFELMQRVQRLGLPWIISVWHLPPRFYQDSGPPRRSTVAARHLAPERWDELLELFGSYLLYLKENYGAEPDLFSFNESDLGIDIHLTPDEHRDAIKRIGAFFAARGLKTKLLLGDTSNPRDTHRFVLATAADTEAMRYVGAVSFHSWGGGTPAQYAAWGDVGEWLHLPLLVAEAGVDPGAYHNHAYDSYDYGLAEASQQQDLLRYARPTASLYWQFTSDYALACARRNGSVEPTGRFWLMKHFTDLTPRKSQALTSASDQPDVKISAFGRGDDLTVHVLNLGPASHAAINGLPAGTWRMVTTTESDPYVEAPRSVEALRNLELPTRSLTTLVRVLPP